MVKRMSGRDREIVLASNNRGKLAELTAQLAPYRVTLHPLARFIQASPDETGTTFRDNALLKARHAAGAARLPAIADDSGLVVDALGGAPGVHSARYAGSNASDAANNQKLLAAMKSVPDDLRSARFCCVLAYVRAADDAEPMFAEACWEGRILDRPRGTQGFGYDPLFLPRERLNVCRNVANRKESFEPSRAGFADACTISCRAR